MRIGMARKHHVRLVGLAMGQPVWPVSLTVSHTEGDHPNVVSKPGLTGALFLAPSTEDGGHEIRRKASRPVRETGKSPFESERGQCGWKFGSQSLSLAFSSDRLILGHHPGDRRVRFLVKSRPFQGCKAGS